jgi:hypothetical protein
MYSFAQRDDTIVKDEPFYGYYLKKTGILHPGRKKIMNFMTTDIDQITNELLLQNSKKNILFLKNMAHHHINVNPNFLNAAKNVFLIRHPEELIVSFSKVIKGPTLDDIGVKKSWELYHQLLEAAQHPIVIDSGELLKDPVIMLEKLCNAIGIAYQNKMQTWPPEARKEDGIWAEYWYHNLHRTTGFVKSEPKKVEVPEDLKSLCEEAMVYYNRLYQISLKY